MQSWGNTGAAAVIGALALAIGAPWTHPQAAPKPGQSAAAVARQQSFASQMDESMQSMHEGMAHAPLNGNPDHDFAAMMIPHHKGAVDMARAELLYGKNPVLRRLAQEIIVTQGSEIEVMRAELNKTAAGPRPAPPQPRQE